MEVSIVLELNCRNRSPLYSFRQALLRHAGVSSVCRRSDKQGSIDDPRKKVFHGPDFP